MYPGGEIQCHSLLITQREYNKNTDGVDLLDSLIALYPNKIRSNNWYHLLMFYFIDMTIVTAWLLYKRDCSSTGMRKEEQMKLYTFKSFISHKACAKVERIWSVREVVPVPQTAG